jgi:hypothetical protein
MDQVPEIGLGGTRKVALNDYLSQGVKSMHGPTQANVPNNDCAYNRACSHSAVKEGRVCMHYETRATNRYHKCARANLLNSM